MSIEALIQDSDDWFIGEDQTFRFTVVEGTVLTVIAAAAVLATSISVEALEEAIANGSKVKFSGGSKATLSAAASIGDISLTVSALSKAIAANETGRKTRDITNDSIEWVMRERPGAATADITKTTVSGITITDGIGGDCEVAVADTDTLTLLPGMYFHTLRKTDDGAELVWSYGPAVLKQAATR